MLEFVCHIDLPAHAGPGAFDHAAVHAARRRVYVAHTANDALDVIDCAARAHVGSIPDLKAVAGALVSEEHDLVFTSNRGEDTIAIVSPARGEVLAKVRVGVRPNGLAYDPGRRALLAASVGEASVRGSFTVSVVDVARREVIATEEGAHTFAFDAAGETLYVFLPQTHRAAVYRDRP